MRATALNRSIGCAIWIVCALVILAAVDTIPDPAAANPNNAQLSASCRHERAVAAVVCSALDLLAAPVAVSILPGLGADLFHYADRVVFIEHAADPSPPLS
jgi:hypothetical protein